MRTLFITASGTGTGKTYVTTAIAAALTTKGLSVKVLKPVISGFTWDELEETDAAVLIRSLGQEPTPDAIEACSPWRFEAPLSPDMAAKREGRAIDFNTLVRFCDDARKGPGDLLLIEGVGGAMVPLDDTHTVLDWVTELGVPVLVVVGSYLGTLSHTLATAAAIRERGVAIAGVVVDESEDSPVPVAETVETLERFLAGIPVAQVGRGAGPEAVYGSLSEMIGA